MNGSAGWDVLVRGQGVVGGCLALSLSRQGLRVGMTALPSAPDPAPDPDPDAAPHVPPDAARARLPDVRAYALNAASRQLLEALRVWDALENLAITPIQAMDVHGDAGGRVHFQADQQGVPALGWIVEAQALEGAMADALRFAHGVSPAGLDDPARLTAVCEGRDSAWRSRHGVQWERLSYGQSAISARLITTHPHQGVARQWFGSPDVLALLPMRRPGPDGREDVSLSLVWSLPDARADELMACDEAAFTRALTEAARLPPGELTLQGARQRWPLALARADRWCGPGWVLLGDAAHTVHPLAGQGLNLGLGDVRALVDILSAREPWRSPGDERLLRRYVRQRAVPTWAMSRVTDGLLHLFAMPASPVRTLRNQGMQWVDTFGWAKRWLARQAMDPRR